MNKAVFLLLFGLYFSNLMGQDEIWMKPNKGQWHNNVDYKIGIPGGQLFLENTGFTYHFHNTEELMDHGHGDDHPHKDTYVSHTVRTSFIDANIHHGYQQLKPSTHYENYFIGKDPSKWVTDLTLYNQINYTSLYNGIDLHLYEKDHTLKYDIYIQPNIDPNGYKVLYTGQDSIALKNGEMIIYTTRGEFSESRPFAYQIINDVKQEVNCQYHLSGDTLSFVFPEGYDANQLLVIDPVLTFSTYTGSTADNWGMTACPDEDDLLIAAGVVFANGYPTTTGAISSTYNGPAIPIPGVNITDLGVTKFNAAGSGLIFSTYIGGLGSETPHSIIVNDQNELYIMGATSSNDFPIPGSGHQTINNGGASRTIDGIQFTGGTDIYVLKIAPNGNSILAGSFLGGSGNDGISNPNNSIAGRNIAFNYGDQLRGEITLDTSSNVYIASTTVSFDFPLVNPFSTNISGTQDAVVAKFNPDLTTLEFCSYLGGSGIESGNSIDLSSTGDIYMTGGTTSSNFPFATGQYKPNYAGGIADGYVIKLEAPAYTNNPKSTFLGTNEYDQGYAVKLDLDDKVYIYGQTQGNYPVSAAQYSNPNSGQFIHKLSTDLSTSEWSSVFGAGTGNVEISPTAFLVSDCYEIYVAGWGGATNTAFSSATNSTTNGFPVTLDAAQLTTNGSNFWLGVFTPDMMALEYATFMGSLTTTNDHVDGGSSRFNDKGKVYHAVCASCGLGVVTGFPTTPGAYSSTNPSSNCNMAAFLFELSSIESTISTGLPFTCLPNATTFINNSLNGNEYKWHFGDGDSSNVFQPTHLYPGPGIYDVMLIVSDINGCYEPDTAFMQVEIFDPVYTAFALEDTICPGETVQVFATGGTTYSWGPASIFSNPTIANPFATINGPTTITVSITDACGTTDLIVEVDVFALNGGVTSPDTNICIGGNANLSAFGGGTYSWSNSQFLNNDNIATPIATPNNTYYFACTITTPDGCTIKDSSLVIVHLSIPVPSLPEKVEICRGDEKRIQAFGATSYNWFPNYNISDTTVFNPIVFPDTSLYYYIELSNACGTSGDSVFVEVIEIFPDIRNDTIVCPGSPISAWATGGTRYLWSPDYQISDITSAITEVRPIVETRYKVVVKNNIGCSAEISFLAEVFDFPKLKVSNDVYAVEGDLIRIWAEGNGSIQWIPNQFIDCATCSEANVNPPINFVYTAILTDNNECETQRDVSIYYSPLIYVPNVFTPDNNNYNNTFKAVTKNIIEFEMIIYNRWGEIVFESYDANGEWDGYYDGNKCIDGVYIWKIKYTDLNLEKKELVGHITLLK